MEINWTQLHSGSLETNYLTPGSIPNGGKGACLFVLQYISHWLGAVPREMSIPRHSALSSYRTSRLPTAQETASIKEEGLAAGSESPQDTNAHPRGKGLWEGTA